MGKHKTQPPPCSVSKAAGCYLLNGHILNDLQQLGIPFLGIMGWQLEKSLCKTAKKSLQGVCKVLCEDDMQDPDHRHVHTHHSTTHMATLGQVKALCQLLYKCHLKHNAQQ